MDIVLSLIAMFFSGFGFGIGLSRLLDKTTEVKP